MLIPIDKIKKAKHIVITTDSKSFVNASVMYSYILTQHKKVSMSYTDEVEKNLEFLPWYDKLRAIKPTTADLSIESSSDTKALYDFLKTNEIKINQKMATALYAGLLKQYDFFKSAECDGTTFAIANELIDANADYQQCREYLQNRVSLSSFRLKAILLKSLLLKDNASIAELYIGDEDLKASGSSLEDVDSIMKEVLNMVNVKEVQLLNRDENNKTVKNLKEIYFAK